METYGSRNSNTSRLIQVFRKALKEGSVRHSNYSSLHSVVAGKLSAQAAWRSSRFQIASLTFNDSRELSFEQSTQVASYTVVLLRDKDYTFRKEVAVYLLGLTRFR